MEFIGTFFLEIKNCYIKIVEECLNEFKEYMQVIYIDNQLSMNNIA